LADFFTDYGTIVAFFIGLGGLGTFIWNMVKGYNKRQDEKEIDRQKAEDAKAVVLKKDIEDRANRIKADAEDQAEGVKKEVEGRAVLIKAEIATTAELLKHHNQLLIDNVLVKIREVDEKVMKMLSDLTTRADMTNGNVKNIRSEIADVQDDVQSLWNFLEDLNPPKAGREPELPKLTIGRRREQQVASRKKRESIRSDSENQEEAKSHYNDTRPGDSRHGY
jgi:hypothetical protein